MANLRDKIVLKLNEIVDHLLFFYFLDKRYFKGNNGRIQWKLGTFSVVSGSYLSIFLTQFVLKSVDRNMFNFQWIVSKGKWTNAA